MRNFRPRKFGAAAQNWAVIQDTRGVIYVANNDGILEFDGVRWRLIPTAQKTIVRSLAIGSDGKIYVGAVGEIGYLAPDAKGQLAFVSLNESINKQDQSFADVWKTYVTSEGVYFSTLSQLMLYTSQGIKTWKPSTSFHLSFVV